MAEREKVAHLLRRATLGPTAEQVDQAERAGYAATVETLLRPPTADRGAAATPMPTFATDPYQGLGKGASREEKQKAKQARRAQVQQLTQWWVDRMIAAEHQLTEKLVFFWHGHWATSVQKVDVAQLMAAQQEVFRRDGRGDFGVMVKAMLRDAALIHWLDGQRNTRKAPNENLARELMELFTLGIGAYTEADVKGAARALTGWTIDRTTGRAAFVPGRFDDGEKTVLGQTGHFGADELAGIILAQPAAAHFVPARLWFRFASGEPMPAGAAERLGRAFAERDVTALVRALLLDEEFAATGGQLVKQPVEWLVGAARQLGIDARSAGEKRKQLYQGLNRLDQVPFRPPSVGGWPSGTAWLTTFSTQTRLQLSQALAAGASAAAVDRLQAAPASGRPDALARLLVVDAWTDRTRAILADNAKDVRKLIMLGLVSPEYAVQ
ncbi:uncharacterized protein (DUF1800 family) [Allocatelliglobosispora scoriae]|uniref:Uncharacterized protein (DUF1800 family) n=1 Tax=Allocatelliglobosispora scoriae TaxID=643052 RepID=A0A841BKM8_9ACTN|nr:DUF1800 domain-containing protein [Allocatelliglobosispora scoriae]MBB5868834.1 uncharacterized protein (DUF1800 family) [Allocatelliglobosispora scoriae]